MWMKSKTHDPGESTFLGRDVSTHLGLRVPRIQVSAAHGDSVDLLVVDVLPRP
jgi:hypothetical protein